MAVFSSNLLGDKIFRNLKVSAGFWVNRPKFHGNCVFQNDIAPRNDVESLQKKRSHGSPFSYFDPMFEKRSDT